MKARLSAFLFFLGFCSILNAQIMITSEWYSYGIFNEETKEWDMLLVDEEEINVLSLFFDLNVMLLVNENLVQEFSILNSDSEKNKLTVTLKNENKQDATLIIDRKNKEAQLTQLNSEGKLLLYLFYISEYSVEN
jgi:hypothetical protein